MGYSQEELDAAIKEAVWRERVMWMKRTMGYPYAVGYLEGLAMAHGEINLPDIIEEMYAEYEALLKQALTERGTGGEQSDVEE